METRLFGRGLSESSWQGKASLSLPSQGCCCMRGQLSVARWLSPLGNRVLVLTCTLRCQETALGGWLGIACFGNATWGSSPPKRAGRGEQPGSVQQVGPDCNVICLTSNGRLRSVKKEIDILVSCSLYGIVFFVCEYPFSFMICFSLRGVSRRESSVSIGPRSRPPLALETFHQFSLRRYYSPPPRTIGYPIPHP